MIHLETDIEGQRMYFGEALSALKQYNISLGSSWDYDHGVFDGIMDREGGETIYIRLPFQVIEGELDRRNAFIEFEKPFVIKHVVNIGLDKDKNSLLAATGLGQFQEPLDKDGYIHDKSKWQEFGEEAIGDILDELS